MPKFNNAPVLRNVGTLLSTMMTIALAFGLIIGGTAAIGARSNRSETVPVAQPIIVSASVISHQDHYQVPATFIGRIEAAQKTDLGFETGGTLVAVLVDEGDTVNKGQIIAQIDTRALAAERDVHIAAKDALLAKQELAQLNADRSIILAQRQAVSVKRVDESRLKLAQITAEVRRIDATIATIDLAAEKTELRAPFSGRIGERYLDPGTRIGATQPIVSISASSAPRFRVGLPNDLLDNLDRSATYTASFRGQSFSAIPIAGRRDVDPLTRTRATLFEIDAPHDFPDGTLGHLTLTRDIRGNGAWVELSAISEGERGLWSIYLVKEEDGHNVAKREVVELIFFDDDRAFVHGSLSDGASYITNGSHRISAGQTVQTTFSKE